MQNLTNISDAVKRETVRGTNIFNAAFVAYKHARMQNILHTVCGIPPVDTAKRDTREDFVDLSEQGEGVTQGY